MSDRSDELTESREEPPRSTDDLLAETDDMLSGSGLDADGSSELTNQRDPALDDEPAETDSWWRSSESDPTETTEDTTESDSSRLSGLSPSMALGEYFSPKAFLTLVLTIGAGLLAGQALLPVGGRIAGMVGVAFAIGLATSKRRYLEMTAAGVFVGGAAALVNHAILAIAGSGQTIVAIGAAAGLVACVGSYYFGRDLRDGLLRDVE